MATILIGEHEVELDDLREGINKSELVAFCRLAGIPAHRGIGRKVLVSALKGKKRKIANPVDKHRELIMKFLQRHWDAISSQIDVNCHGNCKEHTDFQVVTCWKTNKDILESYS